MLDGRRCLVLFKDPVDDFDTLLGTSSELVSLLEEMFGPLRREALSCGLPIEGGSSTVRLNGLALATGTDLVFPNGFI